MEVKYDDWVKKYGPPFTQRERPAENSWDEHRARLHGATYIGKMLIQASDEEDVKKAAPREAAKYGADFYYRDSLPTYITESYLQEKGSYSYTLGAKGDCIRTRVSTTTYGTGYRSAKPWYCTAGPDDLWDDFCCHSHMVLIV